MRCLFSLLTHSMISEQFVISVGESYNEWVQNLLSSPQKKYGPKAFPVKCFEKSRPFYYKVVKKFKFLDIWNRKFNISVKFATWKSSNNFMDFPPESVWVTQECEEYALSCGYNFLGPFTTEVNLEIEILIPKHLQINFRRCYFKAILISRRWMINKNMFFT